MRHIHSSVFPKSLLLACSQLVLSLKFLSPTNGSDDHTGFSDTPARVVYEFFAFSSVTLNLFNAVFALISLYSLRKRAKTINEAKYKVCEAMWDIHDATRVPDYCLLDRCAIPLRFRDDLRRLLYIMDHHSNINFGISIVFSVGIAFFLVSICIFSMTTRPLVAGVAIALLMITLYFWLVAGVLRSTRTH